MLRDKKFTYAEVEYPEDGSTPIATIESFDLTGKIEFVRGKEHKIVQVNGNQQTLALESNAISRTIAFDHLITADGSKHPTANLLFAGNPAYIIPKTILPAPKHNAYGTTHFILNLSPEEIAKLPQIITPVLPNVPRLQEKHLPALKALGWEESFAPLIYLHINPDTHECYLTGEVPFTTEQAQSQKDLAEWFATTGAALLGIDHAKLQFNSGSAFKIREECFANNTIELGKKGLFILVGDAFLPANFLYGHGATGAVQDGNRILAVFSSAESIDLSVLEHRKIERMAEYENCNNIIEALRTAIFEKANLEAEVKRLEEASQQNATHMTTNAAKQTQLAQAHDQQSQTLQQIESELARLNLSMQDSQNGQTRIERLSEYMSEYRREWVRTIASARSLSAAAVQAVPPAAAQAGPAAPEEGEPKKAEAPCYVS